MQIEFLIVLIPSLLSIMGGVFTLLSYSLFPRTRSSAQVLAVFLAFSGMCYGCITFFHSVIDDNSFLCSGTAILSIYFNNAALFTTVVVASYMRRIFLGATGSASGPGGGEGGAMSISTGSYLFIWGLPGVLAALPLTTRHYGHNENDVFCWITHDENDAMSAGFAMVWQAVVVGIPATVGICYNVWVYYRILRSIRAWSESGSSDREDKAAVLAVINRIRWYPIILALVYILPVVHRIHQQITGENTMLMSALGAGSLKMQGFLDSITYGLTPSIIAEWKTLFSDCRYCCLGSVGGDTKRGQSNSISDDKPILSLTRGRGIGFRTYGNNRSDNDSSSFRTSASEASVSEVEVC